MLHHSEAFFGVIIHHKWHLSCLQTVDIKHQNALCVFMSVSFSMFFQFSSFLRLVSSADHLVQHCLSMAQKWSRRGASITKSWCVSTIWGNISNQLPCWHKLLAAHCLNWPVFLVFLQLLCGSEKVGDWNFVIPFCASNFCFMRSHQQQLRHF